MSTPNPVRRRRGYQQPVATTGRPVWEAVYLVALAVTAGADVVAFDQVLSDVLNQLGPVLVWVAVAGFTAMALTLAHFAGRLLRDRHAEHGPDSQRALWLLVIPWALLGLAALIARLIIAQSNLNATSTTASTSGTGSPAADALSAAFLFLILYLASGAVAGFGEYLTRNPLRTHYRTALRAHRRSLRRLDRSQPPYERAVSVWRQHEQSLRSEEENYQAAVSLHRSNGDELKRLAAYLIAAHLQDPSATDGMTLPDRVTAPFPAPGSSRDDTT